MGRCPALSCTKTPPAKAGGVKFNTTTYKNQRSNCFLNRARDRVLMTIVPPQANRSLGSIAKLSNQQLNIPAAFCVRILDCTDKH